MGTVKKIPMRKCVGCGEMKNKKEMLRVLKTPENVVVLDDTGRKNGRGAYVCKNSECLKKAIKARRFERSLSVQIPDEVYSACEEVISKNE